MPDYVIVERVVYTVRAKTPAAALRKFLEHPDGDRAFFTSVEERTVEGPDPASGQLDVWDPAELVEAHHQLHPQSPRAPAATTTRQRATTPRRRRPRR